MNRVALALVVAPLIGAISACQAPESSTRSSETGPPTFTKDVAGILDRACVSCHQDGGAAPFPLGSYEDARRRARQIADVTRTRYMPPWLPDGVDGLFEGERVLSPAQIAVLERWADDGAPEGGAEPLPPPRVRRGGWELGEPDLVVAMAAPFELPAEGGDVFRNFVVPVPLDASRFVEAFEFRPSERRLVHHATITVDSARASRRLDAADREPGFDGMRAAPGAVMPDGHFLGWTPGKSAFRLEDGMSWQLPGGSDLVVQLHMPTTGKPETVHAQIGLYFTESPPRVVPVTLRLGSRHFEIPAGTSDFAIEDQYVLPVDVALLSIYPHAHYLAREMTATAVRPDGSVTELVHISEWDFNWQDFYRYRRALSLPKDTRLEMRYTYDNSDANPRNPQRPPADVAYGPQSTDEMGDLYLQVLPSRAADLDVLRADFTEKELTARVRELSFRIDLDATDGDAHNSLGVVQQRLGRGGEAVTSFRRALSATPGSKDAHFNLASLLVTRAPVEAIEHADQVLRSEPSCADCRIRKGNALRALGRLDEAIAELETANELAPRHAWARYSLGLALQLGGRLPDAIPQYQHVVRLTPDDVDARVSLGAALAVTGECRRAIPELEHAARLAPDFPQLLARVAWGLTTCPDRSDAGERAVTYARRAAELTSYADPYMLDSLATSLAAAGDAAEARVTWQRALELSGTSNDERFKNEVRQKLASLAP